VDESIARRKKGPSKPYRDRYGQRRQPTPGPVADDDVFAILNVTC